MDILSEWLNVKGVVITKCSELDELEGFYSTDDPEQKLYVFYVTPTEKLISAVEKDQINRV